MLPIILIAPVLLTLILPVPVCEMPVIVNGAAVLISEMLPIPVFVALKLVTTFALFNVVPVAEVVVSKPPVIDAVVVSAIAPLELKETLLVPAARLPVTFKLPVLLTDTVPVPVCEMPVIDNGAAVLINAMLPMPVLVALKLVTTFALFKVVPVAELVVNKPPVINAVLASANAPLEVKETLFVPAAILPVTFTLPVLLTVTVPVPVWLIPLIARGAAVLIKLIAPPLLVALNVLIAFAPFKVWPPID
jgi:hypothetical protein